MDKIIKAQDSNYISEIEELGGDLPDNVRLNKVLTGCGGTTVAITNDVNYVIAVPFVEMIRDKGKQNPHIQQVFGDISQSELLAYKGNKWMCTYDSLPRVMELINPKEYKLLVDESHKLVDSGSFRGKAIRTILNSYTKFGSYVFMTATPVPDDLQYEELKSIPKVKIEWNDIQPVEVSFTQLENGKKDVVNMLLSKIAVEHNRGIKDGNAHIFLNSVKSICNIVKLLRRKGVRTSDINVVVARNERNIKLLGQCSTMKIGSISTSKKINFYTATAFEGCDIKDEDGIVYVASDGFKDHTKINILSTLPQIIGRIRNLKKENKNKVNLIFSPNAYYNFSSEQEFKEYTLQELDKARGIVEDFGIVSKPTQEAIVAGSYTHTYLFEEDEVIYLNEQSVMSELYNYRTVHSTYYVKKGIIKGNGSVVNNDTTYNYAKSSEPTEFSALDNFLLGKKPNFVEIVKTYVEYKDQAIKIFVDNLMFPEDELTIEQKRITLIVQEIEAEYEDLSTIYNVLGVDRMRALRFRRKQMNDEVIYMNEETTNKVKIGQILDYRVGSFISSADIKADLNRACDRVGSTRKPKATDIINWYVVKSKTMRNKETKKVEKGFIIVRKNLI